MQLVGGSDAVSQRGCISFFVLVPLQPLFHTQHLALQVLSDPGPWKVGVLVEPSAPDTVLGAR